MAALHGGGKYYVYLSVLYYMAMFMKFFVFITIKHQWSNFDQDNFILDYFDIIKWDEVLII